MLLALAACQTGGGTVDLTPEQEARLSAQIAATTSNGATTGAAAMLPTHADMAKSCEALFAEQAQLAATRQAAENARERGRTARYLGQFGAGVAGTSIGAGTIAAGRTRDGIVATGALTNAAAGAIRSAGDAGPGVGAGLDVTGNLQRTIQVDQTLHRKGCM